MLAFDEFGGADRACVVLLHGWPLDRTVWADVVGRVTDAGFRVVCPDLPGFGASPPLELARWTVEAYADEVVALLASLVGDSVALAGHSFGGYVALAIAERHPNLVAGLGLVASRTVADTNVARQGRRDSIEKVRAHGSRALLPDLAAKLVAPEAPRSLRERAGRLIEVCPPEGIVAGLTAMAARPDRTHVLEEFRHPALVVHGAADQLIPAAEAARVSRSDTWLFRQLLPGVGHMPMWEAPSETAAVLVDWAKVALAQGHPPGALNSARRT